MARETNPANISRDPSGDMSHLSLEIAVEMRLFALRSSSPITTKDLKIQGGAKKYRASISHCKYSENSVTELRGNW